MRTHPAFTDWAEEKVLKHVLNIATYTPPTSVWWALGYSNAGAWAELSGNGYQRREVVFKAPTSGSGGSTIKNESEIIFGPATADWTGITQFRIYDAKTAGNAICTGVFPFSIATKSGESQVFAVDALEIGMSNAGTAGGGDWSYWLQGKILDHVFRNTSLTPFWIWPATR